MSQSDSDSKSSESTNSLRSLFDTGFLIGDRYRILRFIARGGMGLVYEVEDETTGERLALKALKPDIARLTTSLERFRREIRLTRRIVHPNVCRVFEAGQHPLPKGRSIRFFTMELLLGPTLSEYLEEHGAMTADEAEPIVRQMASGLGAAHRAGVAHRDFKPSNVILVREPEGMRAVITDFGLARSLVADEATLGRTLTQTGQLMGTPAYFAPELLEGERVQGPGDFYALGVVVYEMLTGELPFTGRTPLVMALKRLREPAIPLRRRLPDVPAPWDRLVTTCLQRYPKQRFEKAEDLLALFDGEEYRPSTTQIVDTLLRDDDDAVQPKAHKGSRGRWLSWLTMGLLVVLCGIVALLLRPVDAPIDAAEPVYTAILPPQFDVPADSAGPADETALAALRIHLTLQRIGHRLPGLRILEAPLDPAWSTPEEGGNPWRDLAVDEVIVSRVAFRDGGWWVDLSRRSATDEIWQRTSSVGEEAELWCYALADSLWQAYGSANRRSGLGARFEVAAEEMRRLVDITRAAELAAGAAQWRPLLDDLSAMRRRAPQFFEAHLMSAEAYLEACRERPTVECLDGAEDALTAARLVAPGDLRVAVLDLRWAIAAGDAVAIHGAAATLREMSPGDVELALAEAALAWQDGRREEAVDVLRRGAQRHASWALLASLTEYEHRLGGEERAADSLRSLRLRASDHTLLTVRLQRLRATLAAAENAAGRQIVEGDGR